MNYIYKELNRLKTIDLSRDIPNYTTGGSILQYKIQNYQIERNAVPRVAKKVA